MIQKKQVLFFLVPFDVIWIVSVSLHKVVVITLILAGAGVMLVSIIKYHSTIRLAQTFLATSRYPAALWYRVHHWLMIFFLLGYVVVLFSIVSDIRITSDVFTAIIFFFGAAFVLIGILLQANMLKSIKRQHQKVLNKNLQLSHIEDANIYTLAYLAEIRDSETGKHIERTAQFVKLIAESLSRLPKYSSYLTPRYIDDIVKSAPLHDIGKVGVPDAILKKPGKLDADEFETIKLHCEYGANVLKIAEKKLNFESYLTLAIQLVMYHHERWDGNGYPEGLKGEAIPLSAQIMAIADVYDALRSERCYKEGFTHEKSREIILQEKGKHFSPDIVTAFLQTEETFKQISSAST